MGKLAWEVEIRREEIQGLTGKEYKKIQKQDDKKGRGREWLKRELIILAIGIIW